MSRTSLILILMVLLTSFSLLSVLSMILTGYPEYSPQNDSDKKREGRAREEEPSILLFKVAPATPNLYWSIWSADFYTGSEWLRTTNETILDGFPRLQEDNATRVFTVEMNTSLSQFFLPLASPSSAPANISLASVVVLKFYVDTVGNAYRASFQSYFRETPLSYKVSWHDLKIDDRFISLETTPDEILGKYLQLPDLPIEVFQLARTLEDPSYSVLDQILADVQYLRTNFVYDFERLTIAYQDIVKGSDISSYMDSKRGACVDAATALAIILRIQNIPARISVGYKAGKVEGGKLLYYTTGAHSVTEVYLHPYGWVQFDATPPLEEDPLLKLHPLKKVSSPGSRLFHQLSITNRGDSTDSFKLFIESTRNWSVRITPAELRIETNQTADALLEVVIPEKPNLGDKNTVKVTVASMSNPEATFSAIAIIQVENILQVSTKTTIRNMNQSVFRGNSFKVNGTVLTENDEQIENMTIYILLTNNREAEDVIVGKGSSKRGNFEIEFEVPISKEIGDYTVNVISVGTKEYTPSNGTSPIRVRATTGIEFGSEEELPLGYGVIHGHLVLDNGTGLPGVPISFEINYLSTPSEISKLQNLTLADGSFGIENPFENPGLCEVRASFSGDEFILGSDATHIVDLVRGTPAINIFADSVAVRGEVFNFTGKIQFGNVGIWGERAVISFDNQPLMTIETGDQGSYNGSFPIDHQENLGLHFLAVALEKSEVSITHNVVVKSKTTLNTKVSDVAGGLFFLCSASLSDDQGLPIQDAEIIVDNYDLSYKTDKNGNVAFLLDVMSLGSENLLLTARFEGSELHLPASSQEETVFEPMVSLLFLVPLVLPIPAVFVFVSAMYLVRKPRDLQTSIVEAAEKKPTPPPLEEFKYEAHEAQKIQPLKILLPDIEPQLPNVWGIRDKLRIEIVLDKVVLEKTYDREVEVLIDGETATSVKLSQEGRAEFSHAFTEKGHREVVAVLREASSSELLRAKIELRVVDYEEEIIRLYNEFLSKLVNRGIRASNDMTAREIEALAANVSGLNPANLRNLTNCFEKAEYSNRSATRRDYKILYLSLIELNLDAK